MHSWLLNNKKIRFTLKVGGTSEYFCQKGLVILRTQCMKNEVSSSYFQKQSYAQEIMISAAPTMYRYLVYHHFLLNAQNLSRHFINFSDRRRSRVHFRVLSTKKGSDCLYYQPAPHSKITILILFCSCVWVFSTRDDGRLLHSWVVFCVCRKFKGEVVNDQ